MAKEPYYLTSQTIATFGRHGKVLHRATLIEPEGLIYDLYSFSLKTSNHAIQPRGPAREKYRDIFTTMLRYLGDLQNNDKSHALGQSGSS